MNFKFDSNISCYCKCAQNTPMHTFDEKNRDANCGTKAIQIGSKAMKMLSQSFVQTSPDSISLRLFHNYVYPTSNTMFIFSPAASNQKNKRNDKDSEIEKMN